MESNYQIFFSVLYTWLNVGFVSPLNLQKMIVKDEIKIMKIVFFATLISSISGIDLVTRT